MPSRWAALRATVQAVGAVSAAPQLFISTPLEPKEAREAEVVPALPEPASHAQLPRLSRRRIAKEEKEATPEPQLICTPRTRSPQEEAKAEASRTKADGESMRASPQLRLSLKKTDLRRAGSRSNQVSPLPTEQLDLRIGDAVSTPPATSKAHRRPQFLRQMTTGTSRKLHDREAVPTKKLFRNATTHFDESVQQRPDETEQVSEDSSPWSRPLTVGTSPNQTPKAWIEETPDAPSRTTSGFVNSFELDELADLPSLPSPAELPESSEGSFQRVPSSESERSHPEPSKDLVQRQTSGQKQTAKSGTRNRSRGRDQRRSESVPKEGKKESKESRAGKKEKRKTSRARSTQSDLSEEGKNKKATAEKDIRKRKTSRTSSRASSRTASPAGRRSSDLGKRRSSGSPKPSSQEALVQQRQSIRARFASEVPEKEERKSGKVTFLRKAWSQARCALLGLQEPQVQDDNDPRAKGLRGWDAARALAIGTGRALNDIKNVVSLVKKAADEAYHRHRVQQAIIAEIGTTLRGSMANVSDEMDETIGDVLADLTRLKWLDMTQVGALVCEAILNFDDDEDGTITSPESLRDQLLEHVQSLPDREEVLGMDDAQIEALLDNIMHQTESLRDQLRMSVRFSHDDSDHHHYRSKLRQMDSTCSHLSGMDTVETSENRESVESILSRMGSRDSESQALEPLKPVEEAKPVPKPLPTPPRALRPGTQSPRPRTADKGEEAETSEELPLQISSSSTLPRERPKVRPMPTGKQLEMAQFSQAAGLLEVSKRSVLYAAMTTFPYMQTFPVVLAQKVPNPEMREVSATGAVLPILVTPRPLSPNSRRHVGASP